MDEKKIRNISYIHRLCLKREEKNTRKSFDCPSWPCRYIFRPLSIILRGGNQKSFHCTSRIKENDPADSVRVRGVAEEPREFPTSHPRFHRFLKSFFFFFSVHAIDGKKTHTRKENFLPIFSIQEEEEKKTTSKKCASPFFLTFHQISPPIYRYVKIDISLTKCFRPFFSIRIGCHLM